MKKATHLLSFFMALLTAVGTVAIGAPQAEAAMLPNSLCAVAWPLPGRDPLTQKTLPTLALLCTRHYKPASISSLCHLYSSLESK